jgi:acetyl-CoA carboxylase biotin carboxyl carrier protein
MGKSTPPTEPLSRQDVRELIQLIRKNDIQEFELEQGDLKLRIVTSRPPDETATNDRNPPPSYPSVVYPSHPGYLYSPAVPVAHSVPSPNPAGLAAAGPVEVAPPAAPPQAVPADTAAPKAPAAPEKVPEEDDPTLKKVTSPMVGTFYRAPAPDAKPYVELGHRVEEDTVLCIVEAMKLMNEIKAEMRGLVRRILVENGQPVEYGQPMFLIEPS